jgi:two-component system phosphate regulon response regulator OmpR
MRASQREDPTMEHLSEPLLLIVDDEAELRELLAEYFGRYGMRTCCVASAEAARAVMREERPALAILDVHMHGESGLSLARWLRERHGGIGIVLLTAASDAIDRVVGLEMGADDYVGKPFEPRELLARVRGLLRRLQGGAGGPAQRPAAPARRIAFGSCELDLEQRKLWGADGVEIPLTTAEFDLLSLFARSPNRPLNRDQIMEQAHNRPWDVLDRSIDLRVMRLRRKIERNPDKPEVIKTLRNVGYVFVAGDGGPS